MKNQTTTTQPLAVSERTKQDGEMYDRWSWVEVAVWTPRMLTALETLSLPKSWHEISPRRRAAVPWGEGAAGTPGKCQMELASPRSGRQTLIAC